MVSPDGIRAIDNYLLISTILNVDQSAGYPRSTGSLFKYVPSTDTLTAVYDPTGVMNDFDKIIFNHDKSLLFGTRNDVNPQNYSTIMAMASCDDWETNNLLYSFQTGCADNTNPPGIAFIDGDLVSLCANGFQAGPYKLQRVPYVTKVVTGGNKFCGQSTQSLSTCPSTSSSNELSDGAIAGIAIATFAFGGVVAFLMTVYLYRRGTILNTSKMEMSSSSASNPMTNA